MNEQKLQKLFNAARDEPAQGPAAGFEARVMRALRREPRPEPFSLAEQLGELFPRLALAAAMVIGLCVAADLCLSAFVQADLSASVAEASEQWLFAVR
jgi:hypothetical protein